MSTSKRIAELNNRYRFVSIDTDARGWSQYDGSVPPINHSTVEIRLSNTGYTTNDSVYTFDDLTLGQAIKRVHRAVFNNGE